MITLVLHGVLFGIHLIKLISLVMMELGVHRFPWRCNFRKKRTQTCPEAVLVLPNGGC